jgi:hypothetical protein
MVDADRGDLTPAQTPAGGKAPMAGESTILSSAAFSGSMLTRLMDTFQ